MYYKFFEGLLNKEQITKDQFKQYKFVYAGTLIHSYDDDGKHKYTPNEYFFTYVNSMKNKEIFDDIEPIFNCICGVNILHNCLLHSKKHNKLLLIGSCCADTFNETGKKKICSECDMEHKNIKSTKCNDCRKKEKLELRKVKKYRKCRDCGNEKPLNKFNKCLICNTKNKVYDECASCKKPKKEQNERKYKYCLQCNLINHKFKNKHFIV